MSVYFFQCDLCDANYLGYTARHLHHCISEHHYSAIGKHLKTQHGNNETKTDHCFKVLRKCNSKFDCLVFEMLYMKDIKPSLNTQADSICAKLFTWHFRTFFSLIVFLTLGIIPIGPANISCIVSNFIYSFYTLYFFTFQLDNGVT